MVGLKSIWITISALFLLAACVPQTKQSNCGKNEAFNASLRTCVPIVGGPESFVTVKDFVPASVVSKSKDDFVYTTFTITVNNPYNQAYTVIWERTFNGVQAPLTPDSTGLTVSIQPYFLGQVKKEIGVHIITAKIKVGSTVVDSHNFQLVINETPKPAVRSVSVTPNRNAIVEINPASPIQSFNFFIDNRIGLDPLHNWRTTWTVVKNNSTYATEIDTFSLFGSSDTNFPEYLFDPAVAGIGNYTVRAVVSNNPPAPLVGEVVDEVLWIMTVKHPDIGKVIAANQPLVSTDTIAFHGVDYATWGFRNGVSAASTKSQFCVQVDKPEGAYTNGAPLDLLNLGVVVRYYKDGVGTPIFEGFTDAALLKSTVCFSEASLAEQANLFYADGSSTVPHYKTLVARVFDQQTGLELCVDGTTCPIAYPINWKVLVRPKNTPITARILNSVGGDNISYAAAPTASTTSINGTVSQDTNFIVRFSLADLSGEYDTALDLDKFQYTAVLKRGSTIVTGTGCNKTFADVDPLQNAVPQDNVGAIYECQFNIASSDGTGPIAPGAHTLTIQAEDSGSPVPGSAGVLANLLTWNLTVNESNTVPSVALTNILDASNNPVAAPDEGTLIKFQLAINDFEKDAYNLTVYKCSNAACTGPLTSFVNNSINLTYGSTHYNNNYSITYTIPEDEIGNVASGTIYFKAVVTDSPNTSALALFNELIIPVNITEFNAAPVISTTALTAPAVNNSTAYDVFSGYRFSISTVGAVTDASAPASGEATLTYQWWIREEGAATWTAIDGATSATLNWTPGSEIDTTLNHEITFCVTDGSYARPSVDPSVGGSVCSPQDYLIRARSNLAGLTTDASFNGEVAIHHVPSERLSYVAYANGSTIYIRRISYRTDGRILTTSPSASDVIVSEISFTAASGANSVKDLSITSTDNSVLVAYLSNDSTIPGSYKPRVRRININNTTSGTKTGYTDSTRKFGYGSLTVSPNCSLPAECTWDSTLRRVNFGANTVTGDIVINGVSIPASAAGPTPTNSFCSNCTATNKAQTLATAINSSTDPLLQGITATYTSPDTFITIYGLESTSAYDSPSVAMGLGRIVVKGTTWHLPVIDSGAVGANQNKILILNGSETDLSSVDNTKYLTSLETASAVDNALTPSGNMLLGYVTLSGSIPKITELSGTPTSTVAISPITLFSGSSVTDIKVKASLGVSNPNVFVAARTLSGNYNLARLPSTLATSGSQGTLTSFADTSYSANSTILSGSIIDLDIEHAVPLSPATTTNEARLVVISDAGTGNFNTYLFRWKQTASSPYEALDASEGEFLENSTSEVSATSKIASAPIGSLAMGSNGSVSENTNATLAIIKINSNNQAEFGLLNTEIETINSTTRDATGLFRPALVR